MTAPLIAFDVGSTLIHPDFATLAAWLAEKSGVDLEPGIVERNFRQAIAGDPLELNDDECQARLFFTRCALPASTRHCWRAWWDEIDRAGGAGSWLYSSVDPEAGIVLEGLRNAGCRLVAASNSDGTLREELQSHDLLRFFEATFDSTDMGHEKPSAEFYRTILRTAETTVTLHVGDDLIKDFVGAIAAGFRRALLYDPARVYCGLPSIARIHRLSEINRAVEAGS